MGGEMGRGTETTSRKKGTVYANLARTHRTATTTTTTVTTTNRLFQVLKPEWAMIDSFIAQLHSINFK